MIDDIVEKFGCMFLRCGTDDEMNNILEREKMERTPGLPVVRKWIVLEAFSSIEGIVDIAQGNFQIHVSRVCFAFFNTNFSLPGLQR